jgi:NTE family protein
MTSNPIIGVALGSGAARGLAHIGVLMALEDNDIRVDIVSGSSAGALVGSLYCCGISPYIMSELAIQIERKMWVDLTVPRRGFIKGDRIEELIKLLTKNRRIEDTKKRLSIIATDIKHSRKQVFTNGLIYKAVRASLSIPGVFVPVRLDDMVLVDGGVIDRVPASEVKKMGADIVIAVDVGFSTQQGRVNHIFDVILQSIDVMAKQILTNSIIDADIIIEPQLSHIGPSKFELAEECIEIGYNSAITKINDIKEVISLAQK